MKASEIFKQKLAKWKADRGYLAELDRKTGLGRQSFVNWLKQDEPDPRLSSLQKIADATDQEVWELLRPDAMDADESKKQILAKIKKLPNHLLPALESVIDGLLKTLPASSSHSPVGRKETQAPRVSSKPSRE